MNPQIEMTLESEARKQVCRHCGDPFDEGHDITQHYCDPDGCKSWRRESLFPVGGLELRGYCGKDYAKTTTKPTEGGEL